MSSPRPHHLMPRGFGGGILLLLVTTTVIEAQSMEEMGMKFISTDIICNDILQQKCFWKKWYWMPNIIYSTIFTLHRNKLASYLRAWWSTELIATQTGNISDEASEEEFRKWRWDCRHLHLGTRCLALSGMVYQNTMLYSHRVRVIYE